LIIKTQNYIYSVMKIEYIYLLQEREFVKTNESIFKIGKTKQENNKRFLQYPKRSILLLQSSCNDCDVLEKKFIKLFKEKYIHRKDVGNEYFEGDYELMKKDINKNIEEEYFQKKYNKSIENKLANISEKNNNNFVNTPEYMKADTSECMNVDTLECMKVDTPECMKVDIPECINVDTPECMKVEDNISLIDNDFIEKEEMLKKENLSYFTPFLI